MIRSKKILMVDNNMANTDWVKSNAFDFPGVKTVQDFELQFGVPASEPARSERLTELRKYPWAKATPRPIHDLLFYDLFQKMSLINLIKASFAGDRSAAGRYAAEQRWKGHVKDATTSAQARDRTQELQPYFGRTKAEYQVSKGRTDIELKKAADRKKGRSLSGDTQLELIADMQGFTGLPKVVSSDEMDRLEKEGWTIAYRGVSDGVGENEKGNEVLYSSREIAEQFRTGEYFAGQGIYGNGIYFASDEKTAQAYAGDGGQVLKVAIPPNALMGRKDFVAEVTEHTKMFRAGHSNGNFEDVGFHGISDTGRALVAKGVRGVQTDVVLSEGSSLMVGAYGGDIPNVIIIYDRSMLAVEESQKPK